VEASRSNEYNLGRFQYSVCMYEDGWNGLEWLNGGRGGVIYCMKMLVMD